MFYASCCELLKVGIHRHHSIKFNHHVLMKLIILYKSHRNESPI
jgi:hypothetical protein